MATNEGGALPSGALQHENGGAASEIVDGRCGIPRALLETFSSGNVIRHEVDVEAGEPAREQQGQEAE